jgi:hypothetical protein
MADHLTIEQLQQFRTGQLASDELLSVSDHIAECPKCESLSSRQAPMLSESASKLRNLLTAPPRPVTHLTYEQLERIAAGGRSSGEIVGPGQHLAECNECQQEIRQFKELANAMNEAAVPAPARGSGSRFLTSLVELVTARRLAIASLLAVSALVGAWVALLRIDPTRDNVAEFSKGPPLPAASERPSDPSPEDLAKTDGGTTIPSADEEAAAKAGQRNDLRVSLMDAGRTVGVSIDGELKGYDDLPADIARPVKDALVSGAVRISGDVADLRPARGALMSAEGKTADKLHLTGPLGEVLMTDTPSLSWQALPGAESYKVEVFDENFNKVASSGDLTGTMWAPRLRRGRTYVWQVIATRGNEQFKAPSRPAPDAKFKILSEEAFGRVERLRRSRPRAHLALGVLYAGSGLLKEALREFEMLARANPRSPLPRKYIAQVRREWDLK